MNAKPWRWPIIISGCLLAGLLFCLWLMWSGQSDANARAAAEQKRIDALLAEKEELLRLLKLSPCEAAKKLQPEDVSDVAPIPQNSPQASLDNIEKACVFLVTTDGKTQVSTGSGFFVAPGYVLTNRHVVEKGGGKALVTSAGLGKPLLADVVAYGKGPRDDYALLRLDAPRSAQVAILPFAAGASKTEKVGAWGFPDIIGKNDPSYQRLLRGDLSATPVLSYSEGVISAILPGSPQIIAHTAPISPGNSGGPLVNGKGEVVGVNSMIQLDDSSFRQASLAIAAADLIQFLNSQKIPVKAVK